ncbi:MAG: site-specific integrase [Myxacorys californica WJT36-NPBG1]|nr:site-specific integrase [Myxacorys californica WJT36-NPBG1]
MKVNCHAQAEILSTREINRLFEAELTCDCDCSARFHRNRALFGVCFLTGCRISESCSLLTPDIYGANGSVRTKLTFRKSNTKGKLKTRSIPVRSEPVDLLTSHHPQAGRRQNGSSFTTRPSTF